MPEGGFANDVMLIEIADNEYLSRISGWLKKKAWRWVQPRKKQYLRRKATYNTSVVHDSKLSFEERMTKISDKAMNIRKTW